MRAYESPIQRQSTICELSFQTTILAVKLNRRRLVVVLEERIYIYDISNMKLLHELETSPNPNGKHFRPLRRCLLARQLTLASRSRLRALPLLRKQLPRLPTLPGQFHQHFPYFHLFLLHRRYDWRRPRL